jgi:hypothetical protein
VGAIALWAALALLMFATVGATGSVLAGRGTLVQARRRRRQLVWYAAAVVVAAIVGGLIGGAF